MPKLSLVRTIDEAIANIAKFIAEFGRTPGLQQRSNRVHSWYACREAAGGWSFGPSKFIGYRDNDGARYLRTADVANGGETERVLKTWFEPVDLDTPIGRELSDALTDFLGRYSRVARKPVRINVLSSELDRLPGAPGAERGAKRGLLARISSDPRICGGRPCIKGTRMRVSDLVDMMAHGATTAEILADFPYIAEGDIAAALAFAARAVDHRIVRAA